MVDTDQRAECGDAPLSTMEPSGKNKESEKKKRSRVKQLLADVKKQVEFWFGDVSLQKDRFLRRLINESRDGYIDISVLTTFNRMKNLTVDCKLIARALKNSTVVEVNLEGTKVRRQKPIGELPKDVDNRTVYVELLPRNVTHDWLKRVFTKCGNVVYISVPRYKTTGHSKGFAFVEFETEEQAQKSVEMLNNPPEDVAMKPGIFPKTKNRKLIPNPPPLNAGQDEDEAKKKKKKKKKKSKSSKDEAPTNTEAPVEGANGQDTEPEPPKKKRRCGTEGSEGGAPAEGTEAPPVKKSEKRRRSQAGENSESDAQGEAPAKLRRTSQDPGGKERDDGKDLPVDLKEEKEDEEKMDDSLLKAKRKRKKKHKEKTGEEVVPLRVMAKQDWLKLKEEYLTLQKRSFAALKATLTEIHQQTAVAEEVMDTAVQQKPTSEERKKAGEKEAHVGPPFEKGCIVKITNAQPLPNRKVIKNALSSVSPVVYVDVLEGDTEGHVRFKTATEAKAVTDARAELQDKHGWQLNILSGDHEQRYWQKILVDRQAKLNRPRDKIRGTEKLISKAEKIIKARAKKATKHIHFMDDDD